MVSTGSTRRLSRRVNVDRLRFPVEQIVRDLRPSTRERNRLVRVGMSLEPMPPMSRSVSHWIASGIGTPKTSGPIWAVVMARDEQVRLPGAVRHLIEQGVDHVVVADNRSTDGTAAVVAELADELPVTLLQDLEPGYYQARKVSRMARAATRRGASWIVPFDADELWYGSGVRLADALRGGGADIYTARMYDHMPPFGTLDSTDPYVDIVDRGTTPGPNKVAFRAHLLTAVHQGNHWTNNPGLVRRDSLEIRHFPFLGLAHLQHKLEITAEAFRRTDFPGFGPSYRHPWAMLDDQTLLTTLETLDTRVIDPAPLGPGAVGNIIDRSGDRDDDGVDRTARGQP